MGGYAYNTIAAVGRQAGEIIGIKGGEGWMREKFGLEAGWGRGFGQGWRQGSFVGLGGQMKSFFGFGFKGTADVGMFTPQDILSQRRYLQTMGSRGAEAVNRATYYRNLVEGGRLKGRFASSFGRFRKAGQFMGEAEQIFRRRRIAGGVGIAASTVLAANTVGLGNIATVGAGAGGGALLGGMIGYGVMGSRATKAARSGGGAVGRRIGGKLGAGIAGIGLITGVL